MQHNALPDDDRVKSRPIYVTPEHPATANYYVCVAEPDAVNLIMKHVAPIDKHRTPFHFIICADRADAPPAGLPSEWQNVPLQCCDRDALSTTLATQLETLTQGCHVIVADQCTVRVHGFFSFFIRFFFRDFNGLYYRNPL